MKILQVIGMTIIVLGMYGLIGTLEYNFEKVRLECER
jgi:hypothetical protein